MSEQELRELDAWIAENVMGWKRWENQLYGGLPVWLTNENMSPTKSYWCPTTDPAQAIEVLKKCLHYCATITIEHHDDAGIALEVITPMETFEGSAPTMELAICLFAANLFGRKKS